MVILANVKNKEEKQNKILFFFFIFQILIRDECNRFNGRTAHSDCPSRTAVPSVPSSGRGARTPNSRAHHRRPGCPRRYSSCPGISIRWRRHGKTARKCLQARCSSHHCAACRASLRGGDCRRGRTPAYGIRSPWPSRWSARRRRSCPSFRVQAARQAVRFIPVSFFIVFSSFVCFPVHRRSSRGDALPLQDPLHLTAHIADGRGIYLRFSV